MHKELELWQFIDERLKRGERVMLLVVAESSGSSPGRAGYKMAVGADGEMVGSIGGGVMEVNLVEESRRLLSVPPAVAGGFREQVHRRDAPNASGMICSGKQTVIFKLLTTEDSPGVNSIIDGLDGRRRHLLTISPNEFSSMQIEEDPPATAGGTDNPGAPLATASTEFAVTDSNFSYTELLGFKNRLYIVGGGHCSLALSELMSRLDFYVSLFDDRPELSTIEKNRFAHTIKIIESYDDIASEIRAGETSYVVVMTLGYASDERVIRSLIDKDFKYFGVLGSNAKMSVMLRKLRKEGLPADKLDRLRTPIGLPISSRTPEEIAVSIAAEIISVKNA